LSANPLEKPRKIAAFCNDNTQFPACSLPVVPPDIPPVIAWFRPSLSEHTTFPFCNSFDPRSTFSPVKQAKITGELRSAKFGPLLMDLRSAQKFQPPLYTQNGNLKQPFWSCCSFAVHYFICPPAHWAGRRLSLSASEKKTSGRGAASTFSRPEKFFEFFDPPTGAGGN
jgi:hypothetical protein